MTDERMLTPEEVAEFLKIPKKTVMNMLRAGRLTGVKVLRAWRIKESDLEAFIEENTNKKVAK